MQSLRQVISLAILLTTLMAMSAPASATQDAASPVAVDGPNDLNLQGIDSEILGTGTSANALSGTPHLRFERITLPAGASLPLHTANDPELLVAESGAPGITDSFGFTGQIATDGGTFFEADAQYSLGNPGAETATVLRLSTSEGFDAPSGTPAPAGAETIVLLDSPLDDSSISEPTLTIAKLTWHPESDPQVLDHESSLGLIVIDGTLSAKSPSGFDGQLAPNTPVVFPPSTPLDAHAGEDGPATALIVAVLDGATPIVAAREPTPTPVPTAMPTLTPTITPTSTQTLIPSATATPTRTSIPTNTPTPTPIPTTPANTTLQLGETWKSSELSVVLTANDAMHCPCAPGLDIGMSITNTTDERLDIDLSLFN